MDKKQGDKDMSQVKYYVRHIKDHYANKYSDKESKTNISLGNLPIDDYSWYGRKSCDSQAWAVMDLIYIILYAVWPEFS